MVVLAASGTGSSRAGTAGANGQLALGHATEAAFTEGGRRFVQTGIASWYGPGFAGRKTSSGTRFDPRRLTAAHRTLPLGTRLLVTSHATGRSVVVTVNDRGPYLHGRIIDLSRAAAQRLGMVYRGVGSVTLKQLPSPGAVEVAQAAEPGDVPVAGASR